MKNDLYSSIMGAVSCTLPESAIMQREFSAVLSNAGIALALVIIASILVWLIYKSVLLRRTIAVYTLIILFFTCAFDRIIQITGAPLWLHLTADFMTTIVALTSAIIFWRQRFNLLRIVYQFKYTIGLLKNLDLLDEANRRNAK